MIDAAHHELLAKVAAMYYQQELTQNQIADALGLSRVKVYRLLKEARETQIVRILIDWPIKRAHEIEAQLAERFGLQPGASAADGRDRCSAIAPADRAVGGAVSGRRAG